MLASIKSSACIIGASVFAFAALIACSSSSSSDNSSGGTTSEAGAETSTGAEAGGADAADAAPVEVNACKTFVDRTAAGASRNITWDFPVSTAPERCMTIKVGEAVTFMGDFTLHPLMAGGGDSPNPFSMVDTTTGKVTFAKAGLYGFACGNHPSMIGAIQVVP